MQSNGKTAIQATRIIAVQLLCLTAFWGCAGKGKSNSFALGSSPEPSAWDKFSQTVSAPFKKKKPAETELPDSISLSNKSKPLDADFYLSVARHQQRTNAPQAAIQSYQKALELNPKHPAATLDFARLQDHLGNFPEAVALYERAVALDPQNVSALNDLGLCQARQGNFDKAAQALEQAVARRPDKSLYRNNLAIVRVKQGRTDDAYQQLATVYPPDVAHYNLGYLLTEAQRPELAQQQFAEALRINPQLAEARQSLEALAQGELVAQAPSSDRTPQIADASDHDAPAIVRLPTASAAGPRALQVGERYAEQWTDESAAKNRPSTPTRLPTDEEGEADEAPVPLDELIERYDR